MPQQFEVVVPIELPPNLKIVDTSMLGENETLLGKTWNYADLRAWLGNKSKEWIEDNILYNPKYSREIKQMIDSGYIVHKGAKGSPWKFKAREMALFLDEHWTEFNW
ncbi:DUF771 domain-containing protein [Enterococcus mediterraneensis]|uniref:DUF771 domain-containing protein n=1 Tax=Enterococcus mediterraneensis TaxID=2364791 RepID=UPI000F04F343|nr:DUF771 domain-containing protein [Enterococcus mediterraneensis]